MGHKKILYFCSASPLPIDDGIKKINNNLIEALSAQSYAITIVVPYGSVLPPIKNLNIIYYNKKRTFFSIVKDFLLLQPLYFSLYYDKTVLAKIRYEDFDIIFYDFFPLLQYANGLSNAIYMMPDSMQSLALSNCKNEKKFLKKLYYSINYLLIRLYYLKIKTYKKLYVSQVDIKIDNLQNSFYFKIPIDNIDYSEYYENKPSKNEICFRGIMSFEPNQTAIKSFYDNIFIKMIEKYPDIRLKVIGKDPSRGLMEYMKKNTIFTGYVDDVLEEMSKSSIHVVPMVSGTGVKTKMLDSISLRRIVFATPMSIAGIFDSVEEARDNGVVVYENYDDFIYYFDKVYKGEIDTTKMTDKAFEYTSKESWANKVLQLEKIAKLSEQDIC